LDHRHFWPGRGPGSVPLRLWERGEFSHSWPTLSAAKAAGAEMATRLRAINKGLM